MLRRILIVDDDPVNARLLETQLAAGGFLVTACNNGASAIAALKRHRFDAVFLDVMMPNPDGLELCRRIRETESHARVAIVFLTGLTTPEIQARACEAGGDRVLTKPASKRDVLGCLEGLIGTVPTPSLRAARPLPH